MKKKINWLLILEWIIKILTIGYGHVKKHSTNDNPDNTNPTVENEKS